MCSAASERGSERSTTHSPTHSSLTHSLPFVRQSRSCREAEAKAERARFSPSPILPFGFGGLALLLLLAVELGASRLPPRSRPPRLGQTGLGFLYLSLTRAPLMTLISTYYICTGRSEFRFGAARYSSRHIDGGGEGATQERETTRRALLLLLSRCKPQPSCSALPVRSSLPPSPSPASLQSGAAAAASAIPSAYTQHKSVREAWRTRVSYMERRIDSR